MFYPDELPPSSSGTEAAAPATVTVTEVPMARLSSTEKGRLFALLSCSAPTRSWRQRLALDLLFPARLYPEGERWAEIRPELREHLPLWADRFVLHGAMVLSYVRSTASYKLLFHAVPGVVPLPAVWVHHTWLREAARPESVARPLPPPSSAPRRQPAVALLSTVAPPPTTAPADAAESTGTRGRRVIIRTRTKAEPER